jgi:predicted lipid-binding transport protein (Tim44 family)
MWLLVVIAFLGLVAILGGAFAGGIFTIVLIPLAVIAFVTAVGYSYFSGSAERHASGDRRRGRPPAPPTAQQPSSVPRPSSPEELADARRSNQ